MNSAHDRATSMKVQAQVRADAVLSLKKESAPRSLDGDSPMTYRKRLLSSLLRYSHVEEPQFVHDYGLVRALRD